MSTETLDNERAGDAHTAAEFVSADVDATMATMTDDPTSTAWCSATSRARPRAGQPHRLQTPADRLCR